MYSINSFRYFPFYLIFSYFTEKYHMIATFYVTYFPIYLNAQIDKLLIDKCQQFFLKCIIFNQIASQQPTLQQNQVSFQLENYLSLLHVMIYVIIQRKHLAESHFRKTAQKQFQNIQNKCVSSSYLIHFYLFGFRILIFVKMCVKANVIIL